MFSDATQLAGDAPNECGVVGISRVVRGPGAEKVQVKIEIDWKTGNAQVLEARTKKTDSRHVTLSGMLGDGLPDNAIGGDHLHYIQAFDDCCYQCAPAAARLWIDISGDVRICGAELKN
jgi:hypothetical protein